MILRTLTGALAAAAAIWIVLAGPPVLCLLVVLCGAGMAHREFDRLFFSDVSMSRQLRGLFLVLLCVLVLHSAPDTGWVFLWLPLFVLAIQGLLKANLQGQFEQAVHAISLELFGIYYVVATVGFILPFLHLAHGREFLLLLFFMVFAGDTFAYFVGTLFGRHRIAKDISPKKSVEGAVGAIIGAFVFTAIWFRWVYTGDQNTAMLTALFSVVPLLSALAQLGDLFESLLKRSRSQKDSGSFLPGHGGILDRLDGLTLAAPAFLFFARYYLVRL
ncbi:phosphatidate cytidylyltransferase [bacterium]|nr:phosphatidate cytidylyltransferase [bacterium]